MLHAAAIDEQRAPPDGITAIIKRRLVTGAAQFGVALGARIYLCAGEAERAALVDEPTRGIDVGAKAEIYQLLNDLARDGLAVVLLSSEMPEVLGLCDRIYVMSEGRIAAVYDRSEATPEKLLASALPR